MKIGFTLSRDRFRLVCCSGLSGVLASRMIWVSKYPFVTLVFLLIAVASMFEFTVEKEGT